MVRNRLSGKRRRKATSFLLIAAERSNACGCGCAETQLHEGGSEGFGASGCKDARIAQQFKKFGTFNF
jgi:hypothetical protein